MHVYLKKICGFRNRKIYFMVILFPAINGEDEIENRGSRQKQIQEIRSRQYKK